MRTQTIRKIVDMIMGILFIVMMGYHITGNKVHEILGIVTFVFFIIHNILNIKWYKTIFKGKYNFRRILTLVVNVLLLIAMLGMIISGIMISNTFSFLNIPTTMFGRSLHMVSTSCGFILMSIHVGLHLNIILLKLNKKMKDSTFEYIYYLIILMLAIYGLYTFINDGLWKDMLLLSKFKFFDYEQSPFIFYLGQVGILLFISFLVYIPLDLKRKNNKSK